jgi:tetratricopeptide (TPR) repeat protein
MTCCVQALYIDPSRTGELQVPVYDAFISYSHAKDKPVASALQSVIQKLGKPWYKRRALRVFRDDTSLSATPQLWPSIEQALAQSRFLLLLTSPEAAASPWVAKEVEYWLANKSTNTLFIGLTNGALEWDQSKQDFVWSRDTPLPAALKGRFPAEPKWVDLSAYRDGADPRNTRFIEAGADFAAAIRDMPKEDLLSQEVRQQRRALRLAVSAAALLLVLAVGAVTAGVIARTQQLRAEKNFAAAKDTVDSLIFDIAQGLRHVEGIRVESLNKILGQVQTTVDRLAATAPGNEALLRSQAAMQDEFATTYLTAGNLAEALRAAEESLSIARRLAAADPVDPKRQRDVSASLIKVGDVKLAQGDNQGALAAYTEALVIRRKLADAAKADPQSQHDVAVALGRTGDAKAGLGDSAGALAAYQDGLVIDRGLLDADKNDTARQRDVAVGLENVGDIKLQLGDRGGALSAYTESLGLDRALVASDPGNTAWQRDLSVMLNRIGDLDLAEGNTVGALANYAESLAVRRRLAKIDADNAAWHRDVSVSLDDVGQVKLATGDTAAALAAYEESLAIRRGLVKADPANFELQQDLASSLDNVGDAESKSGDLPTALASYEESLAIRRRLGASDPSNNEWQRNVSVSLIKIGNMQGVLGDTAAAAAALEEAIAIRQRLAESNGSNVGAQFDVIVALYWLGYVATGEPKDSAIDEALSRLKQLDDAGKLTPKQKNWKDMLLALRASSTPAAESAPPQ